MNQQGSGASTPSSSTGASGQSEHHATAPPGIVNDALSFQRDISRSRNRRQPRPQPTDQIIGTRTPSSTASSPASDKQPTAPPGAADDALSTQPDSRCTCNPRQQKPIKKMPLHLPLLFRINQDNHRPAGDGKLTHPKLTTNQLTNARLKPAQWI